MVKKRNRIIASIIIVVSLIILGILLGNYLSISKPVSENTFSYYWGSVYWNSYSSNEYKLDSTSLKTGYENSDGDEEKHKSWIDWDVSNIPQDAVIKSVVINLYSSPGEDGTPDGSEYYRICGFTGYNLKDEKKLLFESIEKCMIVKTLLGNNRLLITEGWKKLDLGEDAVYDLQNKILLGNQIWTTAFDTSFDGSLEYIGKFSTPSSTYKPYLEIDFATIAEFYRAQGNSCNLIKIYDDEKTDKDFGTLEQCQMYLETSKIKVWRLSGSECSELIIFPIDRTEIDFDTLEECEENKPNIIIQILMIVGVIIGLIILFGGLFWLYIKFGRKKK